MTVKDPWRCREHLGVEIWVLDSAQPQDWGTCGQGTELNGQQVYLLCKQAQMIPNRPSGTHILFIGSSLLIKRPFPKASGIPDSSLCLPAPVKGVHGHHCVHLRCKDVTVLCTK